MKSMVTLLFVITVAEIKCARILAVYPTPSISHQFVFRKITEELVRRGHELTVITTDPIYSAGNAPANLKEIDVHNVSYNVLHDETYRQLMGNKDEYMRKTNNILQMLIKVVMLQFDTNEVQDIINKRSGDYDLILLEAWLKPIVILSQIYSSPIIQVSSYGSSLNCETVGSVTHPLLYPVRTHQKVYNLTMWEKIKKLYNHMLYYNCFGNYEKGSNEYLKQKFGPDTPDINKLSDNVNMLFLNQHSIWIENQPVPPSVILMSRMHFNSPKKLSKDLQVYLDSSKNGVIYFSLGTNVHPSILPEDRIQMLVRVLSKLPYDVLLKWDTDHLPGRTSNIKIFKWLPQSDLLRHPKIKLFIMQGGLQSTEEAISAGVPLIGLPILGDQYYNVAKYERHHIGLGLDLETLTETEFRKAIDAVIDDKSYRESIKRFESLMKDERQSPLQRAVWWVERVLRHGGAHLRAPAANLPWADYYELELLLTASCVLLAALSVIFACLYRLLNLIRKYGKITIQHRNK